MKLFQKCKDGGKESPVDAYFLIECKGLFSIALLKFNKGSREAFHSHAFDALTWFIRGDLVEERINYKTGDVEGVRYTRKIIPKFTPKENLHRVSARQDSWCFTIRGPWSQYWSEFDKESLTNTMFTHGRVVVDELVSYPRELDFDKGVWK